MRVILQNVRMQGFGLTQQEPLDIVIDQWGKVSEAAPQIATADGDVTHDLTNTWCSPGWIDLHTHCYYGVSNFGVDPDRIGPSWGVSIVVDAGSAGQANFVGLRDYILKRKDFPIYAFINAGSIGLTLANVVSELDCLAKFDRQALVNCIAENRQWIKGVKIRANGVIVGEWGIEPLKLAKKVARETDLPLMVHIGEPLPLLEDILPLLDSGDIVTHTFHGKGWGILDGKKIVEEALEARRRGVLFDVGHGAASFSFDVAETAIGLGFKPDTISTDLHVQNINGPVYDLATTMSKMLTVGLTVEEVIEQVTKRPAQILGEETYQDGLVGKPARFTIYKLDSKPTIQTDAAGKQRLIAQSFRPQYTVIGQRLIPTAYRQQEGQHPKGRN